MGKLHDFYKRNDLSVEQTAHYNGEPSMTRQEFADECNINTIMARYDGYLSDPMASLRREPMYVDWSEMPDTLMGAMQRMKEGEDAFMRLPAVVRKEFDNDPARFVDYAMNPANIEQMRAWELAPRPPEAPTAPQGAPPAATPPSGAPATPPAATPPAAA